MSRKVLDSHLGEADMDAIMDSIIAQNPQLNAQIEMVHNESNVFVCRILRIYPYDDKAYVRILNTNEDVFCRLSHEILGSGISVDYLPNGELKKDYSIRKNYLIPTNRLYGIMIKVRWLDLSDENVLLGYVNVHGHDNLKSSSDSGEVSIKNGRSILSVTNDRVNIITPGLFINGLPYDEPELINHYDKKETDVLINDLNKKIDNLANNLTSDSYTYEELLEIIENYKSKSSSKYTLFRGDCWTINNNFESSASITSTSETDFTVTGTFRTDGDLVGVYWNSKDLIEHPYISYGERHDFRNVVLEFDYEMSGCRDWSDDYNDTNNPCVMTLNKTDGSIYYIALYQFITGNHVRIDFNNLKLHQYNVYIDKNGNSITVDGDMDVKVDDIESIMLIVKPSIDNGAYRIIENVDFECKVSNISVTNSDICYEHIDLKPHQFRLCEGYDDFYNLNPYRVCREMRKLGYSDWVDLYIGASHFYEKRGTVGDIVIVKKWVYVDEITGETIESDNYVEETNGYWKDVFGHERTGKMELITTEPLNRAFSTWLDCYSRELKKNDVDNLIISVSMENLQCPDSWKQVDANGNPALTGWIPSTFFYSPCNSEVIEYMQKVSGACLDIVVENNMRPILQMGEAWWWWNENDTPNQPPCFYDDATKTKFRSEFGKDITEFETSWIDTYDSKITDWLNKQLCDYSDKLREVVKGYNNGLYMALFFPPSVLDDDRVPKLMHDVNYLKNAYSPNKLDILQLEDYDWVTGLPQSPETKERDKSHHPLVYTIGQELGFSVDRLHYYGGFVQYPENAVEYWREIKKAMNTAVDKGFAEVYVWAGSQVRRDCKMLGHDGYEFVQQLLSNI